jgi:hypothetical protein
VVYFTGDFEAVGDLFFDAVVAAEDAGDPFGGVPDGSGVVAGEELSVEAGADEDVVELVEVGIDAGIFVFELGHEDGAAVVDLEIGGFLGEGFDVGFDVEEEFRIVGAEFDVFVFEKPGGVAAEFDFSADVGADAIDDPEAVVLAEFDEASDVGVAVEDEIVFPGFDLIPEDIDGDGVESEGFDFFDAIFPEFGGDSAGVYFAGDEAEGLGVDEELFVFEFEFVGFSVGDGVGSAEGGGDCEESGDEEKRGGSEF